MSGCGFITVTAPVTAALCLRPSVASGRRRQPLNKFHHLRRKVAAAQWLTPLIDAALIMIIACQSCCCFAFPNNPPLLLPPPSVPVFFFFSNGVSYPGVLGCRCPTDVSRCAASPSTPRNLLAANQRPPLHYGSDTCREAGLNGELMVNWVAGKPANENVYVSVPN